MNIKQGTNTAETELLNNFQSKLATPTKRLIAKILDLVIYSALFALFYLVGLLFNVPLQGVIFLTGYLISTLYFLLADGLPNGQSLGKRIVRIKTISLNKAEPCSYFQSFLRNLFLAFLNIIDFIFIFGKRKRRLGDLIANTIVINLKD